MKGKYFSVSVSVEGYTDKVFAESCVKGEIIAQKWGMHKTIFREVEVSVDEMVDLITNGHTFCGLFRHKDKEVGFDAYQKSGVNYIGSQLVCVDIDETQYETMHDFICKLSYPPTIGYYSFSDQDVKGGRHFRLVYVLNRVYSREEIVLIYYTLATQIVYDTDEKIRDNCGGVVEQAMFGTCYKDVYVNRDAIYDITDVDLVGCEEKEEEVQQKVSEAAKSLICGAVPEPKRIFIWDMNHLIYEQFIGKYWGMGYRCIWQTQYDDDACEMTGEGIRYAETSEGHLKLYYNTEVMCDGEKRRKTLYKRMCLRRLMKPDITIEELLYCAMIDRYKFIDNSDGVVSNECLVRNAKNAFRITGEAIRIKYKKSIDWCKAHRAKFVIAEGVANKKQVVPKVRKYLTDKKIGEVYDMGKSFTDNLADMTANGIKVSERRLKKWCKEHSVEVERKLSNGQKAARARNDELARKYDMGKKEKENAVALGISESRAHRVKQLVAQL